MKDLHICVYEILFFETLQSFSLLIVLSRENFQYTATTCHLSVVTIGIVGNAKRPGTCERERKRNRETQGQSEGEEGKER